MENHQDPLAPRNASADSTGTSARFGLIVHHDDAVREWAYDRDSKFGRLDKALDAAPSRGWLVVNMKGDWAIIYPANEE